MATCSDRHGHLVENGGLVKFNVTSGWRFLYETFILAGLFPRLNDSDLLGDRFQNHFLEARVDEFVRLGQLV